MKIDLHKGKKTYESPIIEQMETEKNEQKGETHEAKYQEVKLTPNQKNYNPQDSFKVKFVSGGYGHTAAITGIDFMI